MKSCDALLHSGAFLATFMDLLGLLNTLVYAPFKYNVLNTIFFMGLLNTMFYIQCFMGLLNTMFYGSFKYNVFFFLSR